MLHPASYLEEAVIPWKNMVGRMIMVMNLCLIHLKLKLSITLCLFSMPICHVMLCHD